MNLFYHVEYMQDMKNKLNVLYEDNHVIVVEKPFNILSQADNTNDLDMLSIVKAYIKEKYNKPGDVYLGLVHRLDRPTGGIMVFARTSKAASRLSDSIRNGKMTKKYLAIVNGYLEEKEGILEDYLLKLENNDTIVDKRGKYAKLSYKVLKEIDNLSLVDITLDTGRHHQIRVQFASREYPLYGDQRYGKMDKKQLALYAYYLSFPHPTKDEVLEFRLMPNGNIWDKFL